MDPDPTRRVDPDADRTRQLDAVPGATDDDGYVTVPARPPGEDHREDEVVLEDEPTPARSRGRDWAIGLAGVAAGLLLAVIVAFLAGEDRPVDDQVAAAQDEVAALEAERDELAAQNDALEARVTDAEAAAGGGDDELARQRAALDERAAALDQREAALDDREATLAEREAALDEREAALEQRERDGAEGGGAGSDGGGTVDELLPDGEEVEGFFDRVVDRIRELF